MATNKNPSVTVVTKPFILSYPTILKAEPYMENGKPKGDPVFSFEAISTLEDLESWNIFDKDRNDPVEGKIEVRLVKLAKEKWGDDFDVVSAVKHKGLSWPFKKGDDKADEKGEKAGHYRGKKFFRAKALAEIKGSPNTPALYFQDSDGDLVPLQRGTESGRARINELFYGGAICSAELTAVAGTTGDNRYVTFYFNCLVFHKDGDRLGGGSAIQKLYGVKGGESATDPTEGMKTDLDDEIPF